MHCTWMKLVGCDHSSTLGARHCWEGSWTRFAVLDYLTPDPPQKDKTRFTIGPRLVVKRSGRMIADTEFNGICNLPKLVMISIYRYSRMKTY